MPTAAYYQAHRALLAEQQRRRDHASRGRYTLPPLQVHRPKGSPRRRPVPFEPIPSLETAHPLVAAALRELRPYERAEIGGDMDAIALDLVATYCLAALEGTDPCAAVKAARSCYRADRRWLVHGLTLVDDLRR